MDDDRTRFLGMDRSCSTEAIKEVVLSRFRDGFDAVADMLISSGADRRSMSSVVNSRAAKILDELTEQLPLNDRPFATRMAVLLRYCHAVISLEYRHKVWPYNLIDFSRRVGELWEDMCCLAWEHSTLDDVEVVDSAPRFSDVRAKFLSDLWDMAHDHPEVERIVDHVDAFTERMDDISMESDKVFLKGGIPHVIDFKFSFKSNEKGNRNRLSEVAWAYGKWDMRSVMLIAVCQTENNAYLDTLEGGWEVVTGRETYERIGELTGVDLCSLLDETVAFRSDLSKEFVDYIDNHVDSMASYLDWQAVREP